MALTTPPSGGTPTFNYEAWKNLVRTEIKAMERATRLGTVEAISRRIMSLCENSGFLCDEFATYPLDSEADLVNRVYWLAKEYGYYAQAAKTHHARIEKMLSVEVAH